MAVWNRAPVVNLLQLLLEPHDVVGFAGLSGGAKLSGGIMDRSHRKFADGQQTFRGTTPVTMKIHVTARRPRPEHGVPFATNTDSAKGKLL